MRLKSIDNLGTRLYVSATGNEVNGLLSDLRDSYGNGLKERLRVDRKKLSLGDKRGNPLVLVSSFEGKDISEISPDKPQDLFVFLYGNKEKALDGLTKFAKNAKGGRRKEYGRLISRTYQVEGQINEDDLAGVLDAAFGNRARVMGRDR